MNDRTVQRTLVTGMVVALAIVAVAVAPGLHEQVTRAAVQDSPAESTINAPPAAFSEQQLRDAYDAAFKMDDAAEDIELAVLWLAEGAIEEVPLTDGQKQAIKEKGFGGLVRGEARYQDLLSILDITQAELDTWAATHPQPEPCYESLGCTPE